MENAPSGETKGFGSHQTSFRYVQKLLMSRADQKAFLSKLHAEMSKKKGNIEAEGKLQIESSSF